MCDCDGGCEMVITDCCAEMRPECEVAEIVDSNGDVDAVTCLIGFGCAADAKAYLDKLRARFA